MTGLPCRENQQYLNLNIYDLVSDERLKEHADQPHQPKFVPMNLYNSNELAAQREGSSNLFCMYLSFMVSQVEMQLDM